MLHSLLVFPFEISAIGPCFNSEALLQVIAPLAFKNGPIAVQVLAVPVGLIVLPLAVVAIAIRMYQSSLTSSRVPEPVALKTAAIWPKLYSFSHSVLCSYFPLANILHIILKGCHSARL